MASRIVGARKWQRAMKQLPDDLRANVADALKETVDAVHARGKANIASMLTRRSGELEKNYRRSVSKKSLKGRVGYLSRKAASAAFYARFVDGGTINMAARPFHTNAVEAEREHGERRMREARDKAIRQFGRG